MFAITSVFGSSLVENEITIMESKADSVSIYLKENIQVINELFAAAGYDSDINYLENIFDVIVDDKTNTYHSKLLDFDSDKGYILLSDDFMVFDFSIDSEPIFKSFCDFKQLYYFLGFGYYDFDGIEFKTFQNYNQEDLLDLELTSVQYEGQRSSGAGDIFDLNKYLIDKYDSQYILYESRSLNYTTAYDMYDLSLYTHNSSSEGNCGLVSAYNVLQYLATKPEYNNLPLQSSKINYYSAVKEPNLYSKYSAMSNYYVYTSKSFPTLYATARKDTYDRHGKVESFTIGQTSGIIENTMSIYGYSINFKEDIAWGVFNYQKYINDGKPLIWSTTVNTYGAHSMMAFGYKSYRKAIKVLFLTFYDYAFFIELSDGWSIGTRYMDLTSYFGFASFSYY
jgi:hypothetical protein